MIRYMKISEIDKVIDIWETVNVEAHDYISEQYWRENKEMVKEAMENSNMYVYIDNNEILGFSGMTGGSYLAGIFVLSSHRGKGIGKQMIDFLKNKYDDIQLSVYEKNKGAVSFYLREGFNIDESSVDEETGEMESLMSWSK